jgi:Uncharacterised nucleotidyltransferase
MGVHTTRPLSAPSSELAHGSPPTRAEAPRGDNLWLAGAIERLVEAAPNVDAMRSHRLHLAAARLWRSRGREIPADVVSDVRVAALRAMLAPLILSKARAAYGGALMLMKGPEVAAHYPFPSDRGFRDLDLLAEDPTAAHRALRRAGFVPSASPALFGTDHHHLTPLMWPGAPLVVEVHRRPSRPEWLDRVSGETMFRIAVPSATGLPGVLAPEPAAHAVLVVAHAWKHDPLGKLGPLMDAAVLLASADHRRADAFARAWGWERMWNTTLAVMDAVLCQERRGLATKLWGRHLLDMRERVVLENHISRLAAPVWSLPAGQVAPAVARALRDTAAVEPGEDRMTKLRRSRLAIAHAFRPRSEHKQSLAGVGPQYRAAGAGRGGGRPEQV